MINKTELRCTIPKLLAAVVISLLLPSTAYAASCEIKYERTACTGKEKISYKKCKGKQACSKIKVAASQSDCQTMAVKACSNRRLSITKSKIVKAAYDGKAITSVSGNEDFCLDYAKRDAEFNHCDG